jgi:hypothetical protein
MWIQGRTLTGYLVGVIIVLAIINAVAGIIDAPPRYGLAVFSARSVLGALGMYIAAGLYGYRRTP